MLTRELLIFALSTFLGAHSTNRALKAPVLISLCGLSEVETAEPIQNVDEELWARFSPTDGL